MTNPTEAPMANAIDDVNGVRDADVDREMMENSEMYVQGRFAQMILQDVGNDSRAYYDAAQLRAAFRAGYDYAKRGVGATESQLADVGFAKQRNGYKADATEAMAMYNAEVADHAKLEASLIRLSDSDRQLLRMIVPSIDQRSREPNDAWNQAAAVLWLLIDTTDPVAAFGRKSS